MQGHSHVRSGHWGRRGVEGNEAEQHGIQRSRVNQGLCKELKGVGRRSQTRRCAREVALVGQRGPQASEGVQGK